MATQNRNLLITLTGLLTIIVNICFCDETTVCYGNRQNCTFYTLLCPEIDIVRIDKLTVGRKQNNTNCTPPIQDCMYFEDCCVHSENDKTEPFNNFNTFETYTGCSGRQTCSQQIGRWQLMKPGVVSGYDVIEYHCETKSSKYRFCSESNKVTQSIDIMFDESDVNDHKMTINEEENCVCEITNNNAMNNVTLNITIIDLRLAFSIKTENDTTEANCSSAEVSIQNDIINCTSSLRHYDDNFRHDQMWTSVYLPQSVSTELKLSHLYKNGEADRPDMVWVSVTADENFTISCGKTGLTSSTVTTLTVFTTMSDSKSSSSEVPTSTSDISTTDSNISNITSTTSNDLSNVSTTIEKTLSTTPTFSTSDIASATSDNESTTLDMTTLTSSNISTSEATTTESVNLTTSTSMETTFDTEVESSAVTAIDNSTTLSNNTTSVLHNLTTTDYTQDNSTLSSNITTPDMDGSAKNLQSDDDYDQTMLTVKVLVPIAAALVILLVILFFLLKRRKPSRFYDVSGYASKQENDVNMTLSK